jgi:membrane fusion protein (multidrug efflux system)
VVGEGESRFVYVIDKGMAKRVQVRTGLRAGGRVEILEGLRPGQPIVTEGVVKLSDNMKVRVAGPGGAGRAAGKGAARGQAPPEGARQSGGQKAPAP